jgi:hypothetical protein
MLSGQAQIFCGGGEVRESAWRLGWLDAIIGQPATNMRHSNLVVGFHLPLLLAHENKPCLQDFYNVACHRNAYITVRKIEFAEKLDATRSYLSGTMIRPPR